MVKLLHLRQNGAFFTNFETPLARNWADYGNVLVSYSHVPSFPILCIILISEIYRQKKAHKTQS